MPTYGLTVEGLAVMTLEEVRAYINDRVWAKLSPTLDLSDRTAEGQIIGIVSELIVAVGWENLERIYASQDPDKAADAALDALCLLTGTFRRAATKSVVVLTLTGDDGTVVAEGSAARVPDGARFDTLESATLEALDEWTATTAYDEDDRVFNGTSAYRCVTAGTSGSTGPVGTDPLDTETDGTAQWIFMGEGVAAADVEAAATEAGAKVANAGTLTEIVTPVGGWDGVVNILDATVGHEQMDNPSLRVLRELELSQPGTSPADAIRAALLSVDDVTAVTVFVNNTDSVNADGMPPHSVEAMVQGGEDQDIFDALLANVAAGIQTHSSGSGATNGTAEDSQGTEHDMKFSRPEEIPIYIEIDIIKDGDVYPEDGDDQIKQAIVDYGNAQLTGKNAVAASISAQAFKVAGVLDVPSVLLDDAPAPSTSTTISINLRQLAVYDTSRITVNSSDGTP